MTQTSFKLTPRQHEANHLLGSGATHNMLFGGARSGKTFLLMRAKIIRRLAHKSRGVTLRYRFNHLKASIIHDTLPKVMELCFPEVAPHCSLNKEDWFYRLPNGSEEWFGGLDEKERTEKILGQEYSDIFLNECSQIPLTSRNIAMTRLAQNTPLRLRAYYDCNPPGKSHWTYKLFERKLDPDRGTPLADPLNYTSMQLNPEHNRENLSPEYFKTLEALPDRQRKRFLLGIFAQENESALWTPELLDYGRIIDGKVPEMQRILIAVDPSGCAGPEDLRSDEVGIIVGGLGVDGRGYVLEDLSGRYGPGGETGWGHIVANAYERWGADAVVAESNFGGAMVANVVKAVNNRIPFREVKASRGKVVRAEPVALLFEEGKARLVGFFPKLEDQLCSLTTGGYIGDKSPDRADAMVWLFSQIFPVLARERQHFGTPQVMNTGRTAQLSRH